MPVNRNALIRYKTIDKCLQNRYRRWTLDDLIEECSEALYEYEGIDKGISKRTIQLDLQMMRSDKLGYNAPIKVYENKFYTYEEPDYSITNIPLTEKDLGKLSEAVEFMKQFKGFSHFRELDGMVQKLEDHVYSQKTQRDSVIDFEKNENLKGLEHLEVLYQSIIQRRSILLSYQSFKARHAQTFNYHPYLLKEFRNRWFLIGAKNDKDPILTLALDRILDINPSSIPYISREDFNSEEYFKDVIGVTVSPNHEPKKVVMFVNHKHAQYVITKPLHSSQKVVEKDHYGITIELEVQHNFELEKEILGLGDGIMVVSPPRLKKSISDRLNNAIDNYNSTISEKGISSVQKKLQHKGIAVVNYMFAKRILRKLGSILYKSGFFDSEARIEHILDLNDFPQIKEYLLNKNVDWIIKQLGTNLILKEIRFYFGIPDEWFNWDQRVDDDAVILILFLEHSSISSFPILTFPGSHKRILNNLELDIIIKNSVPAEFEINTGSAIFCSPLLLTRFSNKLREIKTKLFILRFGV